MNFPIEFIDLSLFLAMVSIILLVAWALLSSYHGRVNILINKKRLRNATIATSIIFLVAIAIRVVDIVLAS